jgi:hypothetical protein
MPCCYRFHSRNCGRLRRGCGLAVCRGVGAARTRLPARRHYPGSQRGQQSRRGRSASRRQDGAGAGERRDSGRERGRKRANLLPVVAQANLDAGQPLNVAADGARTGRCNLLLRQEAYASAVDPRGSKLSYSSLEFNFALQRANDLSQLAH